MLKLKHKLKSQTQVAEHIAETFGDSAQCIDGLVSLMNYVGYAIWPSFDPKDFKSLVDCEVKKRFYLSKNLEGRVGRCFSYKSDPKEAIKEFNAFLKKRE